MISIAVFNNKGGVGKTTLLCNVAAYLAKEKGKRVLVVDADPQCNATQAMCSDKEIDEFYDDEGRFSIYSIIQPLSQGKGYSDALDLVEREDFACDLLIGDPRLALVEDLLSRDWSSGLSGDVRGLRTTFVFKDLLARCEQYDYVFFDMGPSLGAINRAVLMASDYFISPMSIDIFSLRAIENIRLSLVNWRKALVSAIKLVPANDRSEIPKHTMDILFAGYVTQQYTQKTLPGGEQRAVAAYEKIMKRVPKIIKDNFVRYLQPKSPRVEYLLGTVPNLHSLVPMAQTARKPIFELKAKDGVVGAHFSKVKEAANLFAKIADRLESNLKKIHD